MGIAGIIVFLLTEDLKPPNGISGQLDYVNVIILVVEIIAATLVFKYTKNQPNSESPNAVT